jgi:alpha-glucosidase
MKPHFDMIDRPEALREVSAVLAQENIIAFDTEFIRESTYLPKLALIQAATRHEAWLIDAALTRRGMHYILDIVPNHCGVLHPWFTAAQADPDAPTADFFTFNRRPDDYATWLGVKTLPKLNYRSEKLRQVMYAAPDSIFRHWLQPPYSADGWRIDVANMLARQGRDQLAVDVGRGIRQAVKEENPQAYLMGENFFDGSPQLQGDMLDAVMNYAGFSMPVWYWLGGFTAFYKGGTLTSPKPWTAETLAASWQAYRASIPGP